MILIISFLVFSLAVDLRRYKHISHDTLFMGEKPHPHDANRTVRGHAFLHLHSKSDRAKAAAALPPSTAKAIYFNRTISERKRAVACSDPISPGINWHVARGYFLNARNSQLSAAYLERALQRCARRWACAVDSTGKLVVGPLLAVRTDRSGDDIEVSTPNGANEIGMGIIVGHAGTIAVTLLWFDGEEIVEADMIFDTGHYRFGNSSEVRNVIDFENVGTHEWGHVYGMDDIYDPGCSAVTMYGVSGLDETSKRSLESADINGVVDLYDD